MRRRVLLVYDPPDGGVAENVRRLALGLREHSWEPYVAGPRESSIYDDLADAGIPVARLPFYPGYWHLRSDIHTLGGLTRLIRSHDFQIVHSHNAKAGVLARLSCVGYPAPAIYSPHCFPFVAPYSRARLFASTTIEWLSGRLTDVLLCVADEERQIALDRRIVPEARIRVVHNGCPPCQEVGLDPDVESFRAGRPMAATLCVLRGQKAVEVFVAAAPAILERCPDAVLAVIGNGEDEAKLKDRARDLGLGERFAFFPFRQPSARQLGSIDVLVLSSSWEAFPISILEAMACGVPQVATDVGGTSEAVVEGKTGLLCPPRDPAALADRVTRLLSDEELRRRMGHAAQERYQAEFRVETMVAKTARLYDELVPG